MSRIPNCRTDENYNEKYLNEKDTEFVRGFDWATEMAVDNFFDNFGFDIKLEDSYLSHFLLEEMPEHMQEEYTMEFTFADKKNKEEDRKAVTYLDYIRYKVLEWIELGRNDLITSMLDNMGEEEYEKIKAKVDGNE